MFASINGTRIFFDIEGSGYVPNGPKMEHRTALFVLHGGPGSDHSDFKPWFTPLASYNQIVYLDHRCNGQSDRVDPAECTLEQLAKDVDALRQYLGFDKIHVLGHSFGGMVAQVYATMFPESLHKLVLVCTAPSHDFYRDAKQFAARVGTAEQNRIIPELFEGNIVDDAHLEQWWEVCLSLYFYNQDPALMHEVGNRPIGSLEASNYTFKHLLPQYDVRPQLPACEVDTLIIAARHDWITPVSQAEEIQKLMPNAKLHIFEKSGHMPFIEEQGDYIQLVSHFLNS